MEALAQQLPSAVNPDAQPAERGLLDVVMHSRAGRYATSLLTATGIGIGVESAMEASAYADGQPVNVITVQSADVSTSDIATKHVTILADEHISEKHINAATCRQFKTFMNSGEDANGHRFWFVDHN